MEHLRNLYVTGGSVVTVGTSPGAGAWGRSQVGFAGAKAANGPRGRRNVHRENRFSLVTTSAGVTGPILGQILLSHMEFIYLAVSLTAWSTN